MQPKPNDVLTLSFVIKDFYTDKRGKDGMSIGGPHRGAQQFIANSLLERDLINLDVLNKHRKMSKLRTTGKATQDHLPSRLARVGYDLDGYKSSTYFTDSGESKEFFHKALHALYPDAIITDVTLGVKPVPDHGACA